MSDAPKSFHLSPEVHEYLVAHGSRPDEILSGLIAATKELGGISIMQIAPEQGAFMSLFASAIAAKRVVEVGTFTGLSTLCLARGIPDDGEVIACDISEEWTAVGRPFWEKAGVAHKIDLRIGSAADTLRALPGDESTGRGELSQAMGLRRPLPSLYPEKAAHGPPRGTSEPCGPSARPIGWVPPARNAATAPAPPATQ